MKLLRLLPLTILLVSCEAENPPSPEVPNEKLVIPLRSSEERRFDEKLAGIHEKWMGTPWTFSGTSQTPGEGSIACGYFVTTTLQQAGMEVERVRLAQAASEQMILAIADPDSIRRFSNASLEDFLEDLRSQGEGYYIVGLDNHTGFLKVSSDGTVAFVHSGPGRGVVSENPAEASELANSRYRVTGKLAGTEASPIP